MEQRSSSGFGRGWIPMERDIGLPHDAWPAPRLALPFTAQRQVRFLHHLSQCGHVRRACELVGISAQAAYVHKRRDEAFARGWDAALVLARDAAEDVLADRALNGTRETIFYRGEAVGHRVRFDPRLLLAHLARLDRHHADAHAEGRGIGGIAVRFDEYLGELLNGEPRFLPPEDDLDPPEPTEWHPARPTREAALAAARQSALYAFPADLADLPPEILETLDPDTLGEEDLWPRAMSAAQDAATAQAAEVWDSETEAHHAQLDALCNSSPSSLGEGDHPQGGGGAEPAPEIPIEPPIETKSLKSPPAPCQPCQPARVLSPPSARPLPGSCGKYPLHPVRLRPSRQGPSDCRAPRWRACR